MGEQRGNETPNTPGVSETALRGMKLDQLRELAKQAGVRGASGMRKDELVHAVAQSRSGGSAAAASRGAGATEGAGEGPDGGRPRTGGASSRSLKYAQEITSPDEQPERPGRSLVTTNHEVIKRWAEARGAVPATVEGTEHEDRLGVLTFDFGDRTERLRHVSWDEWFKTFDERHLNFIYQEQLRDGRPSNFFRLESPEREDA